jgi:hypothetical protein
VINQRFTVHQQEQSRSRYTLTRGGERPFSPQSSRQPRSAGGGETDRNSPTSSLIWARRGKMLQRSRMALFNEPPSRSASFFDCRLIVSGFAPSRRTVSPQKGPSTRNTSLTDLMNVRRQELRRPLLQGGLVRPDATGRHPYEQSVENRGRMRSLPFFPVRIWIFLNTGSFCWFWRWYF